MGPVGPVERAGSLQRMGTLATAVALAGLLASCTTAPAPATLPPPGPRQGPDVGAGVGDEASIRPQPAPGSCHYTFVGPYPRPDPACTPGAIDPRVTQQDIGTTICTVGWTAGVRPPERVTGPEKVASAAAYGYTGPSATAEYDHLVPLELGGAPNDPANLWVEPNDRQGATSFRNTKDVLESTLRRLVCSGRLTLADARRAIASDWVTALRRFTDRPPPPVVLPEPGVPTRAP